MYGWRARIGLLVPSNNNVIEPEMYGVVPNGVSVHGTMMYLDDLNDAAVHEMEAQALRGVRELAAARADVIVYACMGTTFSKEAGWGTKFRDQAHELSGRPCTTASLAMLAALEHLGVHRIAVGTPYPAFVNPRVPEFFNAHGYDVVGLEGLGFSMNEVVEQSPDVAYRLARTVNRDDAEAICILATDFRTLDVIEALESDLGKPVITTNQAILWQALQLAGVHFEHPAFGQLTRSPGLQVASLR